MGLWGYSTDGESYSGACATREQAIEEAREEHPDHGSFWIGSAVRPHPGDFMPDADFIITQMQESAWDDEHGGDWSEDFLMGDERPGFGARAELEDFLRAWAKKHCKVSWYSVENSEEVKVEPVDD